MLTLGLVTAILTGALTPPLADTPYSPHTDMAFGTTPTTFIEIPSGQLFSEGGWCSDKDTYLTDNQTGTEHLVISTALDIQPTITSGAIIATNQGLSEAGVATKTLTIRALTVSVQTTKVDKWKFVDTGPTIVNDGYKESELAVVISPPGGAGGVGR